MHPAPQICLCAQICPGNQVLRGCEPTTLEYRKFCLDGCTTGLTKATVQQISLASVSREQEQIFL